MKTKKGYEIYLEGCDVRERSKAINYDDISTRMRKEQHEEVWISAKSLIDDLTKEAVDCPKGYSFGLIRAKHMIEKHLAPVGKTKQ